MRMLVVGQVSSLEDAKEIENIMKLHIIGNRARVLAKQVNGDK